MVGWSWFQDLPSFRNPNMIALKIYKEANILLHACLLTKNFTKFAIIYNVDNLRRKNVHIREICPSLPVIPIQNRRTLKGCMPIWCQHGSMSLGQHLQMIYENPVMAGMQHVTSIIITGLSCLILIIELVTVHLISHPISDNRRESPTIAIEMVQLNCWNARKDHLSATIAIEMAQLNCWNVRKDHLNQF